MQDKIIKFAIPSKVASIIHERVWPLIEYHTKRLNLYNISKVVEDLTRDAYIQGLTDGEQIGRKNERNG
jgi:hypothetical protein